MDLHVFIVFLPAALAQIQPDVRFDEQNDRFDLSSLMQQGTYDQWNDVMDARRADGISVNNDKGDPTTNATSKFMEALKAFQQNFHYNTTGHSGDESDPSEPSDPNDPNEKPHLRRDLVAYIYEMPGGEARRSETKAQIQKDREALMNYAVPITIEVKGMMKVAGNAGN